MYQHIPVMLDEVLTALQPKPHQKFIDCTLGGAGYTVAIAKAVGSTGQVISIDLDQSAIENAETELKKANLHNVILVQDNFRNLTNIAESYADNALFDGIVMDLGLSSAQLADEGRGFSFQADAPLDMAFDQEKKGKTQAIINHAKEQELISIIRDFGEEHFATRIARAIIARRREARITRTGQLVDAIASAVSPAYRHDKRIHFATRTFQALRIATNEELVALREVLPQAVRLLKPGGKLVAVSFHSLEDRIVKQFIKREISDCLCPPQSFVCECHHHASLKAVTKKPLLPSESEINHNPRARSAKMRIAQKL
jgi:16S rRNA (cytosine1402-N4)-methyltransferase